MSAKRPLGVTVMAVVFLALGLLTVAPAWIAASGFAAKGGVALFYALVAVTLPELLVAGGLGLLAMKRWGRLVAIAALFVSAFTFIDLSGTKPSVSFAAAQIVRFALTLGALVYLYRPAVKTTFETNR